MSHLNYSSRLLFEKYFNAGASPAFIIKKLKIHRSTYYRELHKGELQKLNHDYTTTHIYSADRAQKYADYQKTALGSQLKISNDYDYSAFLKTMICDNGFSPYAAVTYAAQNLNFKTSISVSTCYNYIYAGVIDVNPKSLPYYKRKKKIKQRKHQVRPSHGTPIDFRPFPPDLRRFRDWEMDSVIGNLSSSDSLFVLTERKSNYELIFKSKKDSFSTQIHLDNLLNSSPDHFKTFTCDNGAEFFISNSDKYNIYYCHAYHSWERGQNELQNRFIRRFIPKGKSLSAYTQTDLDQIAYYINHYPRKKFNGKCSADIYKEECEKLGILPIFL